MVSSDATFMPSVNPRWSCVLSSWHNQFPKHSRVGALSCASCFSLGSFQIQSNLHADWGCVKPAGCSVPESDVPVSATWTLPNALALSPSISARIALVSPAPY